MTSVEIATIEFIDADHSEDAVAIVRVVEGKIGLALSLINNGDIQVFLENADCLRLIDALREASTLAESGHSE